MFTVQAINFSPLFRSESFGFPSAVLYRANNASQQTKLTVLAQLYCANNASQQTKLTVLAQL